MMVIKINKYLSFPLHIYTHRGGSLSPAAIQFLVLFNVETFLPPSSLLWQYFHQHCSLAVTKVSYLFWPTATQIIKFPETSCQRQHFWNCLLHFFPHLLGIARLPQGKAVSSKSRRKRKKNWKEPNSDKQLLVKSIELLFNSWVGINFLNGNFCVAQWFLEPTDIL